MRRKSATPDEQGSLFASGSSRPRPKPDGEPRPAGERAWKMPEASGKTVAEIRLLWSKRLTPAQVTRVEVELNRLPAVLNKLGFGTVHVERAFVRRRKN